MPKKNIYNKSFQQLGDNSYIASDYQSGDDFMKLGRGVNASIDFEDPMLSSFYFNRDFPNYFPQRQKEAFQVDKEYLDKKRRVFEFLKNLANGRGIFTLDIATMNLSEIKTSDELFPPLGLITSEHYFFAKNQNCLKGIFMKIPGDSCTPSMQFKNLKTNKFSIFQFGDPLAYLGVAKKVEPFSLFKFAYIKVVGHNIHHLVTVDSMGRLLYLKQHIN